MAKKNKFDTRKYMELAVTVMKNSINEPRKDNKHSPLVGAVLIMEDGRVETAFRGELRYGDHAEYTLLERKNRDKKLDGAKLFATLEPCAPGARSHPKISCSERIFNARISEVWVGIEDPDPTVDRKGIKFLQDNGIVVNMFDIDLQDEIRKVNALFIKQAEERSKIAMVEKKEVMLSKKEKVIYNLTSDDFSENAFNYFIIKSDFPFKKEDNEFERFLLNLGFIEIIDNAVVPTGNGILIFGKNPEFLFPQSIIKAEIIRQGNSIIKDFSGPLILLPDLIEKWLEEKLEKGINREEFTRKDEYTFPITILREAIINAIIHRDYDIEGANIYITIDENKIEIKSPGFPVPPLKMQQMNDFNAPLLSRNPKIMYVFAQIKKAEQRGFGQRTFKAVNDNYGLPKPKYSWNEPFLNITFLLNKDGLKEIIGEDMYYHLNEEERTVLEFVYNKGIIQKSDLIKFLGINDKKAQRILAKFKNLELVEMIGAGPSTHYKFKY